MYNFEEKYNEWKSEEDSKPWLIPDDNIEIELIPNTSRLAENPIPPELQNRKSKNSAIKPYISDCIDFFDSDHIKIKRKNVSDIPLLDIGVQKRYENELEKKELCKENELADTDNTNTTESGEMQIPKPSGVDSSLVTNCSEGTKSIPVCAVHLNEFLNFLFLISKQNKNRKEIEFHYFMFMQILKNIYLNNHLIKIIQFILKQKHLNLL